MQIKHEMVTGTLISYIIQQRAKVTSIASGEVYGNSDPRFDLILRHEADKLFLLESIAIDAGIKAESDRTVNFSEEVTP